MQNLNRDLEQEKKLARRSWQGLLIMLGIVLAMVLGMTGLLFVVGKVAQSAGASPTRWMTLGIAGLAVFLVIGGLGSIVLLLYVMRWSMEGQKQNFLRGTRALQSTLPQLVSESEAKAAQSLFSGKTYVKLLLFLPLYLIVVSIFAWVVRSAVQRFLPGASRLISDIILWSFLLGVMLLVGWVSARRNAQQGREQVPPLKIVLLRIVGWLFFLALVVLPLFGLFPLLSQFHSMVVLLFALILLPLSFGFLAMVYLIIPMLWVLAALKKTDYESAIRRSRWLEQIHAFHGAFLNLSGFVLLLAGRYEEAKQLLQDGIRATRRELAAGGADGLDNIGCALTAQGQYDEAIKMFEGASTISPQHVAAFNDWSQVYLFQGIEPKRALELTERAFSNYQASSFLSKWLEGFNFASIHANRAWALALLGRYAEADQALKQAFAGADRSFLPEYAGLHYRAGQIELLRGDRAKAIEYCSQAQKIDPRGHYGQLAEKALHNLGI